MGTLIFDIETIGEDFETFDETTKKALTRWIREDSLSEEEYRTAIDDVKNSLGFSPLTGSIVAIGMLDVERGKSAVYFQAPGVAEESFEEGSITYKPMDEASMLREFWRVAEQYETFVTFNGRGFDVPFLSIRSAVHRVRGTRDLLSNRYLSLQRGVKHVDLLDQLTFYGATRRRPSLHLCCRAFHIETPKSHGIDGDHVAQFFQEKRFRDIARYNARDIVATAELYRLWSDYIRF
ncbi:MAG: ribonuclease H-like domain-containing protein [Candidatus Moraniibacteriota bacterium]|nr:MAG: ribonuclease H-like domain-containing protein [Candidatus Moranbacteria bacterium]